jgi:hypothetical protein
MLRLRRIAFTIVAVGAALAVAGPAMADPPAPDLVRFRAIYSGTYQAQGAPPNVVISATGGEGYARYLGRFEITDRIRPAMLPAPVDGCAGVSTTEIYTATLTGANGDSIALEGTGTGCRVGTSVTVVDHVTVTGGTGRFEGASGNITVSSYVDQTTASVVVSFRGTVSRPGSTA